MERPFTDCDHLVPFHTLALSDGMTEEEVSATERRIRDELSERDHARSQRYYDSLGFSPFAADD